MHELVTRELEERFGMYAELIATWPRAGIGWSLTEPSNSVGAQFACVASGRESYGNAIAAGRWEGWKWAVTAAESADKDRLTLALDSTAKAILDVLECIPWTEERERLLLRLLEHETMHQGQLIRYGYGWGIEFPETWVERWGLTVVAHATDSTS